MTTEDGRFILQNVGKLTVSEMAKKLGRREEAVVRFLRKNSLGASGQSEVSPKQPTQDVAETAEGIDSIRSSLRSSEAWKRIKQEFSKDELSFFEESYVSLMSQFKSSGGVLPSEERQVFSVITLDILIGRNVKKQKKALEEICELETERSILLGGRVPSSLPEEAMKRYKALSAAINAAQSAERERTAEYVQLLQRHESLMKALKSTRDQRVREIESGQQTILGLIKLLQQKDIQQRESRQAELMRLAAEKEHRRLGALHEYDDGSLDRPILSAETVSWGDSSKDASSESEGACQNGSFTETAGGNDDQ
jgi:hypothetical protein